jgi:hypothetical protein
MRLRSALLAVVGTLLVTANASAACQWLGELLERDVPRVKAYVAALDGPSRLTGISLCDGSKLFENWHFRGRVVGMDPTQFVYLFEENGQRRAVAWVSSGGKALPVPTCPLGPRCDDMPEGASAISGDVYTWDSVRPGEDVVIIQYPPEIWSAA